MGYKVLFHYSIFNTGGAEMSILRLMSFLLAHDWEVELVLNAGGGGLEYRLDPGIKVTYLRDRAAGDRFLQEKKFSRRLLLLPDLAGYIYYRFQQVARSIPFLFNSYDLAVISLHGLSPGFCCRWVRAGTYIQWIRNDLSKCDPNGKAARNIKRYYKKIDHYVCVSETSRRSLVDLYPDVKEKAVVIYNILDTADILRRAAEEGDPFSGREGALKVVTVCRLLDKAKGLFRMVNIQRRLHDEGVRFYWFVVGDGADREKLAEKITEVGLSDYFILVGKKDNPFPYYKYADISATLSYYEGLCGAVNEAKIIGKPIIATRFSGIEEQITDGLNGLIVENDEQSIYEGLKRLLQDGTLREKLTNTILPDNILNNELKYKQLSELIVG